MITKNPFKYFKTSPEIIKLAVMYYVRYPLSFRQVGDILFERGIDICHETIRFWVERFGRLISKETQQKRRGNSFHWRWHLDEVFVRINGERFYMWWAVDHEGGVLQVYVSRKRDKTAAKKFLIKTMKKHGFPKEIVTDKLKSYGAALREIGNAQRQNTDQYANNRCENSHLPFRRRERGMLRFRRKRTLVIFTQIQTAIYNHFNFERHLTPRHIYKQNRSEGLSQWRQFLAV